MYNLNKKNKVVLPIQHIKHFIKMIFKLKINKIKNIISQKIQNNKYFLFKNNNIFLHKNHQLKIYYYKAILNNIRTLMMINKVFQNKVLLNNCMIL